jgi:hypothetical protein
MCGTITLDEELIDVIISALKEKKGKLLYSSALSKVANDRVKKDYMSCLEALAKVQEVKDALVTQRKMA